jgi:hypothetical protein
MLSSDMVVEFEPAGPDDEDAARIESEIVNRIIIEENMGYIAIQSAVKDALLYKNGIMRVRMSYRGETTSYDIEDLPDDRKRALVNDAQDGETRRIHGNTLAITRDAAKVEVCAVPTGNCIWQAGYTGPFQAMRFFGEFCWYTRSELIQMDVPRALVDELQAMGGDQVPQPTQNQPRGNAPTKDQDIISCCWCYVLTDLDGDGTSERYEVLVANSNQGLLFEQVDAIPYAMGSPFINPHQISGESLFDHLWQTQNNKTHLMRQLLDNVAALNNGRYIYDPAQTNEADIMNPTPGGGIRSRNPMAVQVLAVPDVAAGILAALSYEDKVRGERGGAALGMMQVDAQVVGETAQGIERQYASREALTSMMGTNLAESLLRGIWGLTHEFLRRYSRQPYTARLRGSYIQVDPRQWPKRDRMNVKIGLTPGQRGHIEATLLQSMGLQAQAMQAGMANVLASVDTLHRTNVDWLRMAGIANPERLTVDPQTPEAQAALQAQAQKAQAMEQMQVQMAQMQLQIEQMKIAQKAEADAAANKLGYYETDARVAIEEAKLVGDGTIELEKTRMNNVTAVVTARERSAGGPSASLVGDLK